MTDKIKVLLIDDDFEYVNNFGWFLERKGYEVFKASNGMHGIEVAKQEKPDVVVCDLLMIDINGDEVLKKVKSENPNSIFIIASAYVDDKTKEKLKNLGAHSFIEKIVKFKSTEEHIRKVLQENKAVL